MAPADGKVGNTGAKTADATLATGEPAQAAKQAGNSTAAAADAASAARETAPAEVQAKAAPPAPAAPAPATPPLAAAPPAPPAAAPPAAAPTSASGAGHSAVGWGVAIMRLTIVALAAMVAFLFTSNWTGWVSASIEQTTDNAYLQADITPLATKVSGIVKDVPVGDFERVKKGDLLVQINDDEFAAQVALAEANVESAQAAIATVVSQRALQETVIAQARAAIDATSADVDRYTLESERQRSLVERSVSSRQKFEEATANVRRSNATLVQDRARLAQQERQVKVLDAQEQSARAALKASKSSLDLARINLAYTRIVAPSDGLVSRRQARPGQFVGVGSRVISIVPMSNIWVLANYKETQMARVRSGQPVAIAIDAFPGVTLKGRVAGWSPATGAQFSLLPPDNATGNFTKVVQRIPVKITFDPDPRLEDLLRPGMSVVTTIDTAGVPGFEGGAQDKRQNTRQNTRRDASQDQSQDTSRLSR